MRIEVDTEQKTIRITGPMSQDQHYKVVEVLKLFGDFRFDTELPTYDDQEWSRYTNV